MDPLSPLSSIKQYVFIKTFSLYILSYHLYPCFLRSPFRSFNLPEVVNKNLEAYYDAWDKFVVAWIIIKIKDPSCVYQWRLQAEVAMRADGKPGMSDDEVLDFVSRYLPAYKAYLPVLRSEGPKGMDPKRLLVVEIDEERNPLPEN